MTERAAEVNEISPAGSEFFQLRLVGNQQIEDALHQIQLSGLNNLESTRQLLSLFEPIRGEIEDAQHIVNSNLKEETLWDQMASAVINTKNLSDDQQGALATLKYFALESLAKGSVERVVRKGVTRPLPESLREYAQVELQEYGNYLAKTLDPVNPKSARFFDAVGVAGRIVGKTAEVGGAAYLIFNLMGCALGSGKIPTAEVPTLSPNPAITEPAPTAIGFKPTPTESGFATEPAPAVFHQLALDQMIYLPGSGGSGRTELLAAGIPEGMLSVYESAGNEWLNSQKISPSSVDTLYISNGKPGDAFRWQLAYRDKISGNIYWTPGTYPTGIIVNEAGIVTYDGNVSAALLPDTANAVIRFNEDDIPVVAGGQPIEVNGVMYYPLIRNPLTGKFEQSSVVATAVEQALPDYYSGLAPLNQFTELQGNPNIAGIIADLRSKPSLLTDTETYESIDMTEGQDNSIIISCNADKINCAVAASVKIMDRGQWRWLYILEMRNADGSRGYLTGYFYDGVERTGTEAYKRVAAGGAIKFVIVRSLAPEYQTKYPYEQYNIERTGVSDLLDQLLKTKIIPRELEDEIVNLTNI